MNLREARLHKAITFIWVLVWCSWQIALLYEERAYKVIQVPGREFMWREFKISTALGIELAWFFLASIGLYAVYAFVNISAFGRVLAPRLEGARGRILALIAQLLLSSLMLHLLNSWFYQGSVTGSLFDLLLLSVAGKAVLILLLVMFVLYGAAWIFLLVRSSVYVRRGVMAGVAFVGIATLVGFVRHEEAVTGREWVRNSDRPNVVIIGVDSLRPDHLKDFGSPFSVMPNLELALKSSFVFTDVLAAQPHTFPSTVSVLTGLWPVNSGARGNLFPAEVINTDRSIANSFKKSGYYTILAMDETRFANFDASYGFDHVVGPGVGVVDFTMAAFSDNVLLNLVSNTRLGKLLFPNIYGNRAIDYVYRPQSFSKLLSDALQSAGENVFLYAHFCAGHWPYRPASIFSEDHYGGLLDAAYSDGSPAYLRALSQADMQIGRLFSDLRSHGYLENAVVVFLSDHGEDFNMKKDSLSNSDGLEPTDKVRGHGGSAFREPQVKVLLAIQTYKNGKLSGSTGRSAAAASLVDVAPTVLEMAGFPQAPADGMSLAGVISGAEEVHDGRIRYVESSFFPAALNAVRIDEGEVLEETARMYRFTPSGRVQVRDDFLEYQVRFRQRAVFLNEWALVMDESGQGRLSLIDRERRTWWNAEDFPDNAPISELKSALCAHWYRDEVVGLACSSS